MKQLVTVAAVVLVASGAMASNFRAADQVYVPAAGHVAGSTGTFISDVWVVNPSTTDSVTVSIIYTPSGNGAQPQYFNDKFTLAPREQKEIVDFFPTILGLQTGFGDLVFNGCLSTDTNRCTTVDANGGNANYRNILVFSRIYQIPPNTTLATKPPTAGQAFVGIPWYNYVSSRASGNGLARVIIPGMRNTGAAGEAGTFRGNIGLMNASQFSTTTFVVTLYDGTTHTQIGQPYTNTLGPLNHAQVNIGTAFPTFTGITATNAYVTVEQTNTIATGDAAANGCNDGCPAFVAYGSVLDNVSGDATTLETMYEQALSEEAQGVIYGTSTGTTRPIIRRVVKRQ